MGLANIILFGQSIECVSAVIERNKFAVRVTMKRVYTT